jgi:tetratricopeptide (TPR) repeat protein
VTANSLKYSSIFGQFKATNKPLIFTYFKDAAISTGSANEEDMLSLWAFQKKLKQLGHFQTVYKNIEGLREHFDNQYAESVVAALGEANNEISVLCDRIGSYHKTIGNLDKALGFFEERSRLGKELYDAYPNNVSFENGLAISFIRLGSIHEKKAPHTRAIEYYKLSAELLSQPVQSFPHYVDFKKNLTWVQNKLSEK